MMPRLELVGVSILEHRHRHGSRREYFQIALAQ